MADRISRCDSIRPCTKPAWVTQGAKLSADRQQYFLKCVLRFVIVTNDYADVSEEGLLNRRQNFIERTQVAQLGTGNLQRKFRRRLQPDRSMAPSTRAVFLETCAPTAMRPSATVV